MFVLIGLGLILRLAIFGGGKRESRRRRARNSRRPALRGLVPRRDASVAKGALLTAIAVVVFAQAVAGVQTSLVSLAILLGVVAAAGLVAVPELTRAGAGIVGSVSLFISRLAGTVEPRPTSGQNAAWLLLALALVAVALTLRLVWAPFRVLSGAAAVGRDRGHTGGTLPLLLFGALDLTSFVLQPVMAAELPSGSVARKSSEIGLLMVFLAIIVVGIAVLPNFTMSVTGIAVLLGSLVIASAQPDPSPSPVILLVVVAIFGFVVRLAHRFK